MTPVEASDRRRVFCARLKSERERRGTSLADIAEATKIKASLLDALERGDLTKWPKGIYRRAFFRDYVSAIGLPADLLAGEFLDVFAEPSTRAAAVTTSAIEQEPSSLRLTFADAPGAGTAGARIVSTAPLPVRLGAATLDMLAVAGVSALTARVAPAAWDLTWALAAVVIAAAYYLAVAVVSVSPGLIIIRALRRALPQAIVPQAADAAPPYVRNAVEASSDSLSTRLREALGEGSALRGYLAKLADVRSITFNRRRQRDLAVVRRRRAEAANRASADEIPA